MGEGLKAKQPTDAELAAAHRKLAAVASNEESRKLYLMLAVAHEAKVVK